MKEVSSREKDSLFTRCCLLRLKEGFDFKIATFIHLFCRVVKCVLHLPSHIWIGCFVMKSLSLFHTAELCQRTRNVFSFWLPHFVDPYRLYNYSLEGLWSGGRGWIYFGGGWRARVRLKEGVFGTRQTLGATPAPGARATVIATWKQEELWHGGDSHNLHYLHQQLGAWLPRRFLHSSWHCPNFPLPTQGRVICLFLLCSSKWDRGAEPPNFDNFAWPLWPHAMLSLLQLNEVHYRHWFSPKKLRLHIGSFSISLVHRWCYS